MTQLASCQMQCDDSMHMRRSFNCTGLPGSIAIEDVHMLPFSLFSVFPDRYKRTLDTHDILPPGSCQ